MANTDVYGIDIYLDENGDMAPTRNGDAYTTKNYESSRSVPFDSYYNVIISLWRKLITNQGDYVHHPEFGKNLRQFISATNPNLAQILESLTREALSSDSRVVEVNSVKVMRVGNTVYITALVTLTIGTVNILFPQLLLR